MGDSLKETVITAALEIVEHDGLNLSFDSIGYAKVFGYLQGEYGVRVTRGSVHERIWDSQAHFRREVLAASVQYFPNGDLSSTLQATAAKADGPSDLAIEVGAPSFRETVNSLRFAQFQSIKALALRFEDRSTTVVLRSELNKWAVADLDSRRLAFPLLLAELGLRARTDLGLVESEVGDILYSLVEGLSDGGRLDHHAGSQNMTASIGFGTPSSDRDMPWSVVAVGVKSFLDALCEEAPGPSGISDESSARGPPDVHAPTVDVPGLRRSRSELKQVILDAAVEVFLRGGLNLRADSLTYVAVFAHLEKTSGLVVHRSSVHPRFWTSNEEFRLEVLARSVVAHPGPDGLESFETPPPLTRNNDELTPPWRQTAHDRIRTAADSFAGMASSSRGYRRLLEAKAVLVDREGSAATTLLRAAVYQGDRERIDRNKALVRRNLLDLGFVVRPEVGLSEPEAIDLFVALVMTSNAGLAFNELAGMTSTSRSHRLARTDGSGYDAWRLSGIAMRSYFDQLYEERSPA